MDVFYTVLWGIAKVLLSLLLFYASLLFTEYLHNLKDKVGKERWQVFMDIARSVVKAMEQVYGAGEGKKKKQEAMEYLTKYLHLSEEDADKLIEAAVWELNHLMKDIGITD